MIRRSPTSSSRETSSQPGAAPIQVCGHHRERTGSSAEPAFLQQSPASRTQGVCNQELAPGSEDGRVWPASAFRLWQPGGFSSMDQHGAISRRSPCHSMTEKPITFFPSPHSSRAFFLRWIAGASAGVARRNRQRLQRRRIQYAASPIGATITCTNTATGVSTITFAATGRLRVPRIRFHRSQRPSTPSTNRPGEPGYVTSVTGGSPDDQDSCV